MKILHVSQATNFSGAEIVLLNALKNNALWQAAVFVPEGGFCEKLVKNGITVIKSKYMAPAKRASGPLWAFRYLFNIIMSTVEIKKAIKSFDPDIVHANHLYAMPYCVITAKSSGKKIVMQMHDIKQPLSALGIFTFIMALFADKIVAVSCAVARGLVRCGVNKDKISVCYNGIDESLISSLPDKGAAQIKKIAGKINVCIAGYLDKIKGHEVLLKSIDLIAKSGFLDNFEFFIIGDEFHGDKGYRKQLGIIAENYGILNKLHFCGRTENMKAVYKNSDIVVVPSICEESLPTVALEAMICGCAVIASNIGGIPEMITDNLNGFLVKPGDAADLADKILKASKMEREKKEQMLSEAKRTIKEKFSIDDQIKHTHEIYLGL